MRSGWWFIGRTFLKIYQNFPYFAPYWAPVPFFGQIGIPSFHAMFG